MAVRAYLSPGISVTEETNPALAPIILTPSTISIVAPARGEESATERLVLEGTTAQTLSHTGVDSASVAVRLASTNEEINAGNYVVTEGSDPDATIEGDEPSTIARRPQPSVAPTVAPGGAGALTGTYKYAISFVNAAGETGIGPGSANVTLSNEGADLTDIEVGPTGTTARNIYRAKVVSGNPGPYHLVASIADNVTTLLNDEALSDASADAAPLAKTGLASGDTVVVAYDYTDNVYFEPTLAFDFDDIMRKYGDPLDADGNIDSELTYAAQLAFQNGASEILALATADDTPAAFDAAFTKLLREEGVRLIVAVSPSDTVHGYLRNHLNNAKSMGLYRQGIVGKDGTAGNITQTALRAAAKALDHEGMILVSPTSFRTMNPVTGREVNIGGQYIAAMIAGMHGARDVQIPVTRKYVSGITGINDKRNPSEGQLDSSSGLLVIEERNGFRVRHGVSTAVASVNTREANVVRAKYEMAARIREVLDATVVGTVAPAGTAALMVQSTVVGLLDQLTTEQIIAGHASVTARLLASDPTYVEVRFSYTPMYAINNVDVRFTIDMNSGTQPIETEVGA